MAEAYDRDQPRRRLAYERLILEGLGGDPTLFVRGSRRWDRVGARRTALVGG